MRVKVWLLAAGVLTAVALTVAASASSTITGPTQIATLETHKVQHQVDLGREGFSPGDVITVSDDLSTPDGATVLGHMHEVCTAIHVRASSLSLECEGTAVFPDGQIAVLGEFPPSDADPSYAIVGGTGLYENVGGKMTIAPSADSVLLTFELVP
jgi:hypothetical protein